MGILKKYSIFGILHNQDYMKSVLYRGLFTILWCRTVGPLVKKDCKPLQ